mmetsp:Transcript_15903/g.24520  ORF Transcript_15903/g.24520 Transcript_15903/m.24520 type:complete len:86 (-) Transcript_15903:34-291(-)
MKELDRSGLEFVRINAEKRISKLDDPSQSSGKKGLYPRNAVQVRGSPSPVKPMQTEEVPVRRRNSKWKKSDDQEYSQGKQGQGYE